MLRRHRAGLRMETEAEQRAFKPLDDLLPASTRELVLDRAHILHLPNSTGAAASRDLLAALMDYVVIDEQGQRAVTVLADLFHRQAGQAVGSGIDAWGMALNSAGWVSRRRGSRGEPGCPLAEFLGFRDAAVAAEAYAHVLEGGLDLHGADAVRAVEEVPPGHHGAVDIALAEPYAAQAGQDDGAGAAAVEAVDVDGEVEVLLGAVEVAEAGEEHA
ncbi:hypothetical protein GCM10010211_01150 [Streptomyces albospinus]|uniref:Uncharacterized protein n=1 Tax=Streptomyces albospinus TaxID=285515 RepID=A0ABQ2UNA2_9ACTN|nr:hypothetical protein GCM10010211_01150 [Streptomyces albospinus]